MAVVLSLAVIVLFLFLRFRLFLSFYRLFLFLLIASLLLITATGVDDNAGDEENEQCTAAAHTAGDYEEKLYVESNGSG